MNKLRRTKKGDLLANMFIVILTLIVFFALYPAVKVMLDLGVAVNAGTDPTLDFMLGSVGFVMLFGVLKWIWGTVSGGGASE